MIDYVNTDIVAYADDSKFYPSFNQAYPSHLDFIFDGYYPVYGSTSGDKVYHSFYYSLAGGDNIVPSGGELATSFPEIVGKKIYAFLIKSYDNFTYTQSEASLSVGVCYYVLMDTQREYFRLTLSDIPSGIESPFGNGVISGEGVYWLYNVGSFLSFSSSNVLDLLSLQIGGYNLLFLMLTSGFFIYAGWVVVKWIIPT